MSTHGSQSLAQNISKTRSGSQWPGWASFVSVEKRWQPKRVVTILGEVTSKRPYYHCRHCHTGHDTRDHTLGDAEMVFDIPPAYVIDPNKVPSATDVDDWLVAIERLWDDDAYHADQSRRSRERAKELSSASIRTQVGQFFHGLTTKSVIAPG